MAAKNYHFTISRTQAVIIAVLLLLICSLCFSMGIILGYGTFTTKLNQQLPKIKELQNIIESNKDASFYETLKDDTKKNGTKKSELKKQPIQKKKSVSQISAIQSKSTSVYQIQVGAFRQEAEARLLQTRLEKKNYQVQIAKADLKEKGIWYRVKVGNCKNKEQANELAKKLQKEEHLPTLIVK